jgi:WD40 repeat protein
MVESSNYSNATLTLISDNSETKNKYNLSTQSVNILGRAPDCQIVLDTNKYVTVSRFHAQIELNEDENQGDLVWLISNKSTTNGTLVNGNKITDSVSLKSGDRIILGLKGPEFLFECQMLNPTVLISLPEDEGEKLEEKETEISAESDIKVKQNIEVITKKDENQEEISETLEEKEKAPKSDIQEEENEDIKVKEDINKDEKKKTIRETKVREKRTSFRRNKVDKEKTSSEEIKEEKIVTSDDNSQGQKEDISEEIKEEKVIEKITQKTTSLPIKNLTKTAKSEIIFDSKKSIWNLINIQEIAELGKHSGEIKGLSFSNDGKNLASVSIDKTIKIWNVETQEEITTLKGHKSAINAVSFSNDGKMIATGGSDKTIKIWNVETQEEITTLKGHKLAINAVSFSNDDKIIASGGSDKTIKIWNVETQEEITTLKGHKLAINALSFSKDGETLISGGGDKMIKLWDVKKQEEKASFITNLKVAIDNLIFSPDEQTIMYINADKSIRLLSIINGEELFSFYVPTWCSKTITITKDGQTFTSSNEENVIKIWRI